MGKNKRHFCKYQLYGCGGSCFGKGRMIEHEKSCRYAPAESTPSAAVLSRFENMESAISMLVRRAANQEKHNKRQEAQIRGLKAQIMELQGTVARITPDYSHVKLVGLHLPRYIMKHSENRDWAEEMIGKCKYRNPKHIFKAFMQKLMEDLPFFWKVKTYDIATVAISWGGRIETTDIPLRDFAIKFYDACFVLITDLWPDTEEINKVPFIPKIMCCGYSEEVVKRMERREEFVAAQYARQHKLELHQQWLANIDSFCDWLREAFREKLNNERVSLARDSLKTMMV